MWIGGNWWGNLNFKKSAFYKTVPQLKQLQSNSYHKPSRNRMMRVQRLITTFLQRGQQPVIVLWVRWGGSWKAHARPQQRHMLHRWRQ